MQLTNTTDYAIRIVCYLAIKKRRVTTAKLASELKIPESYIPKISKQLKKEKIISASEGTSGGYALAKNPEKILPPDCGGKCRKTERERAVRQ